MFWSIVKMYSQYRVENVFAKGKRRQNCEFLSLFLILRRFEQIYKLLCKMKLWDELEKEEFDGKWSVKKVFLKNLQNSQEKPLLESLF